MPSEKQEFSFRGYTADQLLLYAYATFLELGWAPRYAGLSAIVAYTPRTWSKYDDEVMIEAKEGSITVTSSLVHNESFDMMKRNQKHINDFIATFEKVKLSEIDPAWAGAIEKLRQQTIEAVAEQQKQSAESQEIEKVMKFSGSNLYATYTLIALNIIVFIVMAIDGAGIFKPDGFTQIKWGSNYTPLTLDGEWWRIITCMFIHFGIIHLVMNMYGLYMAGVYLEPMLGKVKYTVAYLATGIIASIVSLWWHKDGVNSAGASGAIFGMYGLFLGLLFTNLIPKKMRIALLQTIGILVVFNIIYGMQGTIDNAAHIGGLISGIITGLFYYLFLKPDKRRLQWVAAGTVVLIAFAISVTYLDKANNAISPEMVSEGNRIKRALSHKDGKEFFMKRIQVGDIEKKAMFPLTDSSLNAQSRVTRLNEVSKPQWEKLKQMFTDTETDDISAEDHKEAALWIEYADARLEEIEVFNKNAASIENGDYSSLGPVQQRLTAIINKLNNLD